MTIYNHISWAFNNIYTTPYPDSNSNDNIPRPVHGIAHVSRAALYALAIANLYRKFGHEDALRLTDDDLELIQIAVIFHDSAREGDGRDLWDNESATLCYQYLMTNPNVKHLGITHEKAKMIAEGIANKDGADIGGDYNSLELDEKGEVSWEKVAAPGQKSMVQKIIHDGDCLDIIRARYRFDANHLDFYKDIAKDNKEAFEFLAQLINEARHLIKLHGDEYGELDFIVKQRYEHEDAYQRIEQDIANPAYDYHVLPQFYAQGRLQTPEQLQQFNGITNPIDRNTPITSQTLKQAITHGQVFSRGIVSPTEQHLKKGKEPETSTTLELRKTARRLDSKLLAKKWHKHHRRVDLITSSTEPRIKDTNIFVGEEQIKRNTLLLCNDELFYIDIVKRIIKKIDTTTTNPTELDQLKAKCSDPQKQWGVMTMTTDPRSLTVAELAQTLQHRNTMISFADELIYVDVAAQTVRTLIKPYSNIDQAYLRLKNSIQGPHQLADQNQQHLIEALLGQKPHQLTTAAELEYLLSLIAVEQLGNTHRSVSLLGYGASTFSAAGFLLLAPEITTFSAVHKGDVDSGFRKKRSTQHDNLLTLSPEQKQAQLNTLLHFHKMGGPKVNGKYNSTHTELMCDIHTFDAIYFTNDHCFGNDVLSKQGTAPMHQHAPLLQAVFIAREYEKMHHKTLPLFHYSSAGSLFVAQPYPELEQLQQLWVDMANDYISAHINKQSNPDFATILNWSDDDLKMLSLLGTTKTFIADKMIPADSNYPPDIQQAISKAIRAKLNEQLEVYKTNYQQRLMANRANPGFLFTPSIFEPLHSFPALLEHDRVRDLVAEQLQLYIANLTDVSLENDSKTRFDYSSYKEQPSKLSQVTALCQIIGNESLNELLSARITNYLTQQVTLLEQQLSAATPLNNNTTTQNINNIIRFCRHNKCTPPRAEHLATLIEKVLIDATTTSEPQDRFDTLNTLINEMQITVQQPWLNAASQEVIATTLADYDLTTSKDLDTNMQSYLKLAKLANLSDKMIKPIIKNALQTHFRQVSANSCKKTFELLEDMPQEICTLLGYPSETIMYKTLLPDFFNNYNQQIKAGNPPIDHVEEDIDSYILLHHLVDMKPDSTTLAMLIHQAKPNSYLFGPLKMLIDKDLDSTIFTALEQQAFRKSPPRLTKYLDYIGQCISSDTPHNDADIDLVIKRIDYFCKKFITPSIASYNDLFHDLHHLQKNKTLSTAVEQYLFDRWTDVIISTPHNQLTDHIYRVLDIINNMSSKSQKEQIMTKLSHEFQTNYTESERSNLQDAVKWFPDKMQLLEQLTGNSQVQQNPMRSTI